ncbi:MAG: ice-binding family protein [Candidatus Dormibacteria bacterium]
MRLDTRGARGSNLRRSLGLAGLLAVTALALIDPTAALAVTGTAPGLGVATSFAVLAGSAVTNTGASVISGDLGVSPGSAVTGFPPGTVVNGTMHVTDATATQAQSDLATAYNNAAGQPCTDESGKVLGQDIGSNSASALPPGVYCFSTSAQLTGALHLNGPGVYIFQIATTLTTAPASSVVLENNASSCQVFWQVGSSATLDTTTAFAGTIMALASITINDGVVLDGRALARNGQVSMINDRITRPSCGQASSSTTVTSSANPSTAGQPVTFTATVSGASSGTITFYDGSSRLGTVPVDASGHATLTTSSLTPGTHTITAVFSGTPGLLNSSSPPLVQVVPPANVPGIPRAGSGPGAAGMPWSPWSGAMPLVAAALGAAALVWATLLSSGSPLRGPRR